MLGGEDVSVPHLITFKCQPDLKSAQDVEISAVHCANGSLYSVDMTDGVSELEASDQSSVQNISRADLTRQMPGCNDQGDSLSRGPGRPRSNRLTTHVSPSKAERGQDEMAEYQNERQVPAQMALLAQQQLMPPVPPSMMMMPPHTSRVPVVPAAAAVQQAARLREIFATYSPPPMPPCPWFDPSGISPSEVEELKICFPHLRACSPVDENDRDNVTYVTLRNTLIDVYRSKPNERLTMAECRKHCDGDLAALVRLLSFLDRNRLINFAMRPTASDALTQGSIALVAQQNNRIKDEMRYHWSKTPTCTACDRICLYTFYVLAPSLYGGALPLPQLKPAVWCADCAREAPYNQCLLRVSLPALHLSGGASSWSEAQITLLFDSIEAYGTDWVLIAKKVSSAPGNPVRTPAECLSAFLSMPLAEAPSSACLKAGPGRKNVSLMEKGDLKDENVIVGMEILLTALELLISQKEGGDNRDEMSKLLQDIAGKVDKQCKSMRSSATLEVTHSALLHDLSAAPAEPMHKASQC